MSSVCAFCKRSHGCMVRPRAGKPCPNFWPDHQKIRAEQERGVRPGVATLAAVVIVLVMLWLFLNVATR